MPAGFVLCARGMGAALAVKVPALAVNAHYGGCLVLEAPINIKENKNKFLFTV